MSDYIERKSIRNMYSCLNPEDKVRVEQVVTDIDAIPSADAVSLEEFEQMRFLADKSMEMVGEERPKGKWISEGRIYPPTNAYHGAVCSICGTKSEYLTNFCGECGADMRGREGE